MKSSMSLGKKKTGICVQISGQESVDVHNFKGFPKDRSERFLADCLFPCDVWHDMAFLTVISGYVQTTESGGVDPWWLDVPSGRPRFLATNRPITPQNQYFGVDGLRLSTPTNPQGAPPLGWRHDRVVCVCLGIPKWQCHFGSSPRHLLGLTQRELPAYRT